MPQTDKDAAWMQVQITFGADPNVERSEMLAEHARVILEARYIRRSGTLYEIKRAVWDQGYKRLEITAEPSI